MRYSLVMGSTKKRLSHTPDCDRMRPRLNATDIELGGHYYNESHRYCTG